MKKYLQIIGGTHRGQKIAFDHNDALRPTSGKLKEILFNWIQFEIEDAPVSYTHLTLPTICSV